MKNAERLYISMKTITKSLSLIGAVLLPQVEAPAQSFTTIKHFSGTDGTTPQGALVLSGSTLYGATGNGGSSNRGTIYKVNTDGSSFMVLKDFAGTNDGAFPSGVVISGSTLYGTTDADTLVKLDTNGDGFTVLKTFPVNTVPRGLMLSGSTLFGVTYGGAPGVDSTIYRINTDGSGFTNLHTFNETTDGTKPYAAPVLSGNTLYGTAAYGTALNYGSVYRVNTDGSGFTNLHSFNGTDGATPSATPYAALVLSGNTLFGTTAEGGLGAGTIFRIDTDGSGFTNLYNFGGDGGSYPYAGLTLNGSSFYGVALIGGSAGLGTAFKINADGSGFTVLKHFSGASDGSYPAGEMVFSGDTLYGTASSGGSSNAGTVFALTLSNQSPIVANPIPDQTNTYGGAFNFTFAANTFTDPDAGQTLAYTASNLPPGISFDGPSRTFSGTPTAVGTNAVMVTATDNGSPPLSTNTTFRIVVGKALLTVRALDQTNSYGSFFFLNPYVDAEYSGFKLDDNVLSLASLPDISTTATSSSPVGNYPIQLSGGSASHYDFALQDGVMTITPAPLMVIVHNACRLVNQTNPPLSGRLVELQNSDPITVSFSTAATPSSPAGSYPISVTFSDPNLRLPNYSVSYVSDELTVLPYDYQLDIVHAFGTTNEMGTEDIASTPIAAVMEGPDGVLYGVTQGGGINGGGTVFRVNKDGTGYRVLVRLFTPMYAGVPSGGDPSLIRGTNGLLYGIASGNGPARPGNIFSVDTNGNLTLPHTFSEGSPNGPLLLSTNGFLYGTVGNGRDRIYRIAQDGTAFTNVWESPLSGAVPRSFDAGLIEGTDGWLYGTSLSDGNFGPGTVFRMRSDGSGMTVLHSFLGGGSPVARVIEGSDGWLYGTTVDGGIFFNGSVFKMAKDGTGYAMLHHFDPLSGDGSAPMGALLEGNDGYLYGTTRAGGTSASVFGGTVYRLKKDGSGYCILHNFGVTANDPAYLTSALIQASDGSFYATANFGGMGNKGFVFRLTPLEPPTLAITRSGSNVALSWSPPTPGFVLQQNNSLNVMTWTNSPSGATNPISVPATGDTRLYRLRLP